MGVLSWLLAALLPFGQFVLPAYVWIAVLIIGFGMIGWAALLILSAKTPIEPGHVPTTLIQSGPFRITRNPIYVGFALILYAWAMYLGAPAALLPVLAFPFIITRRFIQFEEQAIRDTFGVEGEHYLTHIPRWLVV